MPLSTSDPRPELLDERAELTDAVCRELASSTNEHLDHQGATDALLRLRRWLAARYGDGFRRYDVGLPTEPGASVSATIVEIRAGSRVCDSLAMLLTADTSAEIRSDSAGIREALREWERVSQGSSWEEGPSYAVHAHYRTMLVIPGGEPRHRSSFDLPGPRVHVVPTDHPDRFEALADELARRDLPFFSAFDPDDPTIESAFVCGLDDEDARELGRRCNQFFVARWDASAWTELSTHGPYERARGWRYGPFRWSDYDLDAIELVKRTAHPIAASWTITGTPGAWSIHARPGSGGGDYTTRSDAEWITDVVAADPELRALHRGTISRYFVHGNVDPSELLDCLTSDATEGAERPDDWPADYDDLAGQWAIPSDQQFADGLPWVDRWASINGRRLSTLWADGRSLVVFRDADVEELERKVEAIRSEAARSRHR